MKYKHRNKTTILYDGGSWFIFAMLFGIAGIIGIAIDYFWNYLILTLTLRFRHVQVTVKRRLVYTVIITVLGFIIDWLYYEITWGTAVIGPFRILTVFPRAGTQLGLEITTILIPLFGIGVINYFAARLLLHLKLKDSFSVGVAMAIFTAPWLILAFVLLHW